MSHCPTNIKNPIRQGQEVPAISRSHIIIEILSYFDELTGGGVHQQFHHIQGLHFGLDSRIFIQIRIFLHKLVGNKIVLTIEIQQELR